jgi:hypothetical protein
MPLSYWVDREFVDLLKVTGCQSELAEDGEGPSTSSGFEDWELVDWLIKLIS